MKPLIGVTCSVDPGKNRFYVNQKYIEAVRKAGGVPVPLACTSDESEIKVLTGYVRGIVLTGGGDVDPIFFGEEPHPDSGIICPKRDGFEIVLSRIALSANIPIFGICRGMQVLNIAAGGDIYQDIYSQVTGNQLVKHRQEAPHWYPTHSIEIKAGTILA